MCVFKWTIVFLQDIKIESLRPTIGEMETYLSAYAAHRSRELQTPKKRIEEIDGIAEPAERPPPTKLRPFIIRSPTHNQSKAAPLSASISGVKPAVSITSSVMKPTASTLPQIKQVFQKTGSSLTAGQLTSLVSSTQAAKLTAAASGKPVSASPITLQISQTPQGTRLRIPTSQINQLSGK